MNSKSSERIVFLDYMRTFAFISVLIGHQFNKLFLSIAQDDSIHASIRLLSKVMHELTYGGAAGVVVFFLTSGYIITHVLQTENTTEFIIKRIFRIYPLFIFAVVLQAVLDRYIAGIPFAGLQVWVPRLLLLGDYFGIPPVLGSVEWTLRLEVSFYCAMAILRALGAFKKPLLLPLLFVVIAIALKLLPPFPNAPGLAFAYFTAYAPYLFIGSCIFLIQRHKQTVNLCLLSIAVLLYTSLSSTAEYLPDWKELNYGLYAITLFSFSWLTRKSFSDGPVMRTLSALTYSVYLFHNWLWNYINESLVFLGAPVELLKIATIFVLFLFCYAINKTVEEYGLNAGRAVITRLRSSRARTPISTPS